MRLHELIARAAAATAALLALVAALVAALSLDPAAMSGLVVELWRVVGLATWTALFVILAVRPGLLAVWVTALVSKLALVVLGLLLGPQVAGAADLVLWDSILSVVLAVGLTAAARMRALQSAAACADS